MKPIQLFTAVLELPPELPSGEIEDIGVRSAEFQSK
jgi:hypothetical protein